jgi:hypothetical protein
MTSQGPDKERADERIEMPSANSALVGVGSVQPSTQVAEGGPESPPFVGWGVGGFVGAVGEAGTCVGPALVLGVGLMVTRGMGVGLAGVGALVQPQTTAKAKRTSDSRADTREILRIVGPKTYRTIGCSEPP